MMAVSMRRMDAGDASELSIVCKKSGLTPWTPESFQSEANNPLSHYVVLFDTEKQIIIGYAGIWCVVDEAQVMNVAILPEYWGKGYGKQLMKAILCIAKDEGCTVMTLEVKKGNERALHLYRGYNFKVTGVREDYYPDHSDGILMERLIEEV